MLYKEEIIVTLNSSNNFKNNKIYTSKSLIQFTLGLFNFSRLIFRNTSFYSIKNDYISTK